MSLLQSPVAMPWQSRQAPWHAEGAEVALLIDLARASSISLPAAHVATTRGFLHEFREHVAAGGRGSASSLRCRRSRVGLLLLGALVISLSQLKPRLVGPEPLTYRIKTRAAAERERSPNGEVQGARRAGRAHELLVEIGKHDR